MVQKATKFRIILNCAIHKWNSRVIFFLSDKKYMAVEAVEWSKWIISVGNVE